MIRSWLLFILFTPGLNEARDIEPEHQRNLSYVQVLESGLTVDDETVVLPTPLLQDGQDPKEQREALLELTGSERALEHFLRDSVTAPMILKTRDVRTDSAIVRMVNLWFVVWADLDEIDLDKAARQVRGQSVEAGNMRFERQILNADDLKAEGLEPPEDSNEIQTWHSHLNGRLLDRIEVEATNRVDVTRASGSMVIASSTEADLGPDSPFPNRWRSLEQRRGDDATPDEFQEYQGGISFTKISQFGFEPGALLVEAHLAFVEPLGWFRGAPILRSKFSVVAQDQIRRLRREIAQERSR